MGASRTDEVADVRPPPQCRSCSAGHTVHPIQWRNGLRDSEGRVHGRVMSIDGRGIAIDVGGECQTFYNHDPDRVRELLGTIGAHVDVQARWSLLWFDTYLVSVRPADRGPLGPCPVDGPSEGGFFIGP